jgi:hypothetical protein
MKIRLIFYILLSTAIAKYVAAQELPSHVSHHFTSINQAGLLTGSAGQAANIQTINGLTWSKWFAGVGTGIDYYGTRSIPLFVDLRRNFNTKAKGVFVYADGGINFPWISDGQKLSRPYTGTSSKGVYLDAGAGLRFKLKNSSALLLSSGYSYKQVNNKTDLMTIMIWPTPEKTYEYYKYEYRRIVMKLGLEF